MRRKQDNRGFTLIELIVATAILGVVAAGAFTFMVAGANSYRSVYTNVSLQYAMQQAMGQMQETILDCNTAMYGSTVAGDDELYLLSQNPDKTYTLRTYTLSDGELFYQEIPGVSKGTSAADIAAGEKHLLLQNVTDFTAVVDGDGSQVASVSLSIQLTRQDKTCSGTQETAPRNRALLASTLANLLQTCE